MENKIMINYLTILIKWFNTKATNLIWLQWSNNIFIYKYVDLDTKYVDLNKKYIHQQYYYLDKEYIHQCKSCYHGEGIHQPTY